VLATLRTRKEMRKSVGVVRFVPGEVERREVVLEGLWGGQEEEEEEEGESEGEEGSEDLDEEAGSGVDDDDMDGDGDENSISDDESTGDEEDNEMEELPALISGKQKRKRADASISRPAKKVAFASNSKSNGKGKGPSDPRTAGLQKPPLSAARGKIGMPKTKSKTSFPTAPTRKVANVPVTKSQPNPSGANDGASEAYDFGKYFGGGRVGF
jgi:nuclear GTP-binding protein